MNILKKLAKLIAYTFAGLLALGLIINAFSDKKPSQATYASSTLPTVTASSRDIYADFQNNEVAATAKYKNAQVVASGRILNITTDFTNDPVIELESDNRFMGPKFRFDSDASNLVASFKKGDKVNLRCVFEASIIQIPHFKRCTLA